MKLIILWAVPVWSCSDDVRWSGDISMVRNMIVIPMFLLRCGLMSSLWLFGMTDCVIVVLQDEKYRLQTRFGVCFIIARMCHHCVESSLMDILIGEWVDVLYCSGRMYGRGNLHTLATHLCQYEIPVDSPVAWGGDAMASDILWNNRQDCPSLFASGLENAPGTPSHVPRINAYQ